MRQDDYTEVQALRLLVKHLKAEIERQQTLIRAQEMYLIGSMSDRLELLSRIERSLQELSRENPSTSRQTVQ